MIAGGAGWRRCQVSSGLVLGRRFFRWSADAFELATEPCSRALQIDEMIERGLRFANRNLGAVLAGASKRVCYGARHVANLDAQRHDTAAETGLGAVVVGKHDHDGAEEVRHCVQDVWMPVFASADAIDPNRVTK